MISPNPLDASTASTTRGMCHFPIPCSHPLYRHHPPLRSWLLLRLHPRCPPDVASAGNTPPEELARYRERCFPRSQIIARGESAHGDVRQGPSPLARICAHERQAGVAGRTQGGITGGRACIRPRGVNTYCNAYKGATA